MTELRFHEWMFDTELLTAQTLDGTVVRFTRQERALLKMFLRRRAQLLTRALLVEVLADSAADMSERNVDFVINRLRRKLRDRARDSRFISTQYGEGYVWIAEPMPIPADSPYLVVGPIHRLDATPHVTSRLQGLVSAFSAQLPQGMSAVLREDGLGAEGESAAAFFIEIYSVSQQGQWQITAVVHDATRRRLLTASKFVMGELEEGDVSGWAPIAAALLRVTAQSLVARPDDVQTPNDQPLFLQLHDAGVLLSRSSESWLESEKIVEERVRTHPDDVHNTLLLASTRLAQLILRWGVDGRLVDDIESMVFAVLPRVEDSPAHMLVAAKLLIGCGRGYLPLAEQLTEAAMERSPALAAGLCLLGQIRMFQGKLQEALELLDQALLLSALHSEFRVYLLVLKLAALLADDDRNAIPGVEAELYRQKPITRMQVGLYLCVPTQPLAPDLAQIVERIGAKGCTAAVQHLYLVTARHFLDVRHRYNVMKGLVGQVVSRFGQEVVPAEVVLSIPQLLEQGLPEWTPSTVVPSFHT